MSSCTGGGYYGQSSTNCPDIYGCSADFCPNEILKRHDTYPPFVASINDCNGPIDLTNTVAEASMWANGKFKADITADTTEFSLYNNIGYYQSMIGDIIIPESARSLEMMLVVGYNDETKAIIVSRGYQGTQALPYKKYTKLRMFRFLNATASVETVTENVEQVDGTRKNVIVDSRLIYNWKPNDTCLTGCYYFEFKLLKMLLLETEDIPVIPSTTFCSQGYGVEWTRRFPANEDGFKIRIIDSATSEQTVIS